jgi:hypothetical protein
MKKATYNLLSLANRFERKVKLISLGQLKPLPTSNVPDPDDISLPTSEAPEPLDEETTLNTTPTGIAPEVISPTNKQKSTFGPYFTSKGDVAAFQTKITNFAIEVPNFKESLDQVLGNKPWIDDDVDGNWGPRTAKAYEFASRYFRTNNTNDLMKSLDSKTQQTRQTTKEDIKTAIDGLTQKINALYNTIYDATNGFKNKYPNSKDQLFAHYSKWKDSLPETEYLNAIYSRDPNMGGFKDQFDMALNTFNRMIQGMSNT